MGFLILECCLIFCVCAAVSDTVYPAERLSTQQIFLPFIPVLYYDKLIKHKMPSRYVETELRDLILHILCLQYFKSIKTFTRSHFRNV